MYSVEHGLHNWNKTSNVYFPIYTAKDESGVSQMLCRSTVETVETFETDKCLYELKRAK